MEFYIKYRMFFLLFKSDIKVKTVHKLRKHTKRYPNFSELYHHCWYLLVVSELIITAMGRVIWFSEIFFVSIPKHSLKFAGGTFADLKEAFEVRFALGCDQLRIAFRWIFFKLCTVNSWRHDHPKHIAPFR